MSIEKGQRIRVTQTIHERADDWQGSVEGTVERVEARPTGSWYAHGKNDKLWLRRLLVRKDDGELVLVNVDPRTRIAILN